MKFRSLTIKTEKEGTKTFEFKDKTLILSDKNSVGKSTLLRILFYSLGYNIPGTYKMRFKNLRTILHYSIDERLYRVERENTFISLYEQDNLIESTYLTDMNLVSWLANIWEISSPYVLKNLLGAIYLDQDKGWTLLNRGTVIGSIHFNIRDLLIGLSIDQDSEIYRTLLKVDKMKKVKKESKTILALKSYAEQREVEDYININKEDELEKELKNLQMKRNVLSRKVNNLNDQINTNNSILNYIDSLHLTIHHNGEMVPVTKKNMIISSDNINFFIQQLAILKKDLIKTNYDINNIKLKLSQKTESLFENKDDEIIDYIMKNFQFMHIKTELLESKISELEDSIRTENNNIDKMFIENNPLITKTTEWIQKFAERLGVLEIVQQNSYLFTRDLKSISGTIYYKVVFAFKMAYIKVIEERIGVKLPIVLDSPSGREVTDENINAVMDILKTDFVDNQIIIASIRKYNLPNLHEIRLVNRLMEENNSIIE